MKEARNSFFSGNLSKLGGSMHGNVRVPLFVDVVGFADKVDSYGGPSLVLSHRGLIAK